MSTQTPPLPRKLWLMWLQGLDKAPYIVRKCVNSWERRNPEWNVICLDYSNLDEHIDIDFTDPKLSTLSPTEQSDLIRLDLLIKYGGVWADATTYCNRPLNEWIDRASESGFFVFCNPGSDRVLSSWFMATYTDSPLLKKWRQLLLSFWLENTFRKKNPTLKLLEKVLFKFLSRNTETTKYWFTPFFTKTLKIYPYFVMHYLFERLISTDSEAEEIWQSTVKISANLPLEINRADMLSDLTGPVKNQIDQVTSPLYKLSWKYEEGHYSSSSILHYLLNEEERII